MFEFIGIAVVAIIGFGLFCNILQGFAKMARDSDTRTQLVRDHIARQEAQSGKKA